jgi:hypothetical protein
MIEEYNEDIKRKSIFIMAGADTNQIVVKNEEILDLDI